MSLWLPSIIELVSLGTSISITLGGAAVAVVQCPRMMLRVVQLRTSGCKIRS